MGVLGQKGRFWIIFGQKGAIFEFLVKKRKRQVFTHFFHFSIPKNQKVLIRGFSGKWVRANERTDGGESKGPSTPSRDQKLDNSDVPIWRKVEKPHFFDILRGLKGIRGD